MRKIIIIFVALVAAVSLCAQTTPNIGLQIPPHGSTNWNLPLNYNFALLDQYLGGTKPLPNGLVLPFVDVTNFKINGSLGLNGQFLQSTGSGLSWVDVNPSGSVGPGSGYKLPGYGSFSSAAITPTNVSTDATGNNLNVPGTETVGGAISGFVVTAGPQGTVPADWTFDWATPTLARSSIGAAASNAATTVNGVSCVLSSSCSIPAGTGPTGPAGPTGPTGPTGPAGSTGPNIQITVPATAIGLNTCTTLVNASLPGTVATSTFTSAFASNPTAANGWGAVGGLVLMLWPSTVTGDVSWSVCNQTLSSITPTAMTFNIGLK